MCMSSFVFVIAYTIYRVAVKVQTRLLSSVDHTKKRLKLTHLLDLSAANLNVVAKKPKNACGKQNYDGDRFHLTFSIVICFNVCFFGLAQKGSYLSGM